jgi:tetratricopeptide (TPR) repeat protein
MTREEAERLLSLARASALLGPDARAWIERHVPERDGIVEATRRLAEGGRETEAAELAANTWRLWLVSGDIAGGRDLLAIALDGDDVPPSSARALALYGDGLLAFRQGAQDESCRRNEAALETARAVGDHDAEALALVGLSRVAFRDGDNGRVRSLALQARELVRDSEPAADVAPLHMLAAGTRLSGELDAAVALYEESLELNRSLGDERMVAIELHNIGHVELHRGNAEEAAGRFAESAELRSPDDPYDVAMEDLNAAALAYAAGEGERARELLRTAESTLAKAGIALDPDDAFEVDWLRRRVEA